MECASSQVVGGWKESPPYSLLSCQEQSSVSEAAEVLCTPTYGFPLPYPYGHFPSEAPAATAAAAAAAAFAVRQLRPGAQGSPDQAATRQLLSSLQSRADQQHWNCSNTCSSSHSPVKSHLHHHHNHNHTLSPSPEPCNSTYAGMCGPHVPDLESFRQPNCELGFAILILVIILVNLVNCSYVYLHDMHLLTKNN